MGLLVTDEDILACRPAHQSRDSDIYRALQAQRTMANNASCCVDDMSQSVTHCFCLWAVPTSLLGEGIVGCLTIERGGIEMVCAACGGACTATGPKNRTEAAIATRYSGENLAK